LIYATPVAPAGVLHFLGRSQKRESHLARTQRQELPFSPFATTLQSEQLT